MDETHRKLFQPLPGVRWGAVATGALLGAVVWLVLLRFADMPRMFSLELEENAPGLGLRVWWVVAPLLASGVASWTGVCASGERGIRDAYLHGFLAWAGALLLASLVGMGSMGTLPERGWSGLAAVVGAVVGAALGQALLAGRVAVPWVRSGAGRRSLPRGESPVEAGSHSQPHSRWREVVEARRGASGDQRPGADEDARGPGHDVH
jgi:hypothetical protein